MASKIITLTPCPPWCVDHRELDRVDNDEVWEQHNCKSLGWSDTGEVFLSTVGGWSCRGEGRWRSPTTRSTSATSRRP
jgi:hypothetical protein